MASKGICIFRFMDRENESNCVIMEIGIFPESPKRPNSKVAKIADKSTAGGKPT